MEVINQETGSPATGAPMNEPQQPAEAPQVPMSEPQAPTAPGESQPTPQVPQGN